MKEMSFHALRDYVKFHNINQIKEEFHIESSDAAEIRKQLRQKQKQIHPDKNGGNFASEKDREEFQKIENAVMFLEQEQMPQTGLVPIETVNELVKVIKDLAPKNQEMSFETRLAEQVKDKISEIKTIYFYPKIGTAAVSAFISFTWLFPSTFEKHPMLGKYLIVDSPYFTALWFYILVFACFIWISISRIENLDKNFKLKLKLEYFQNELFDEFIKSKTSNDNFTKDDFTIFLNHICRKENSFLEFAQHLRTAMFFRTREDRKNFIDIELAQSLSEIIFIRAESRGIIEKTSRKSFSDTYKLAAFEEKQPNEVIET